MSQLRVLRFQLLEPPHERVVFGVGDFRLVENVVQVLVAAKLFPELLDFARGIFHRALNYNLTRNPENTTITAYKNTVLIYNPTCGQDSNGRAARSSSGRSAYFASSGHHVTVAPTTGPDTAGAIARGASGRGADLIVAAGGDGTINEMAEGMVASQTFRSRFCPEARPTCWRWK